MMARINTVKQVRATLKQLAGFSSLVVEGSMKDGFVQVSNGDKLLFAAMKGHPGWLCRYDEETFGTPQESK